GLSFGRSLAASFLIPVYFIETRIRPDSRVIRAILAVDIAEAVFLERRLPSPAIWRFTVLHTSVRLFYLNNA
ncbi:hypothetical protein, partial [Sandarakinorhabdus sp.]|uniref:hypothetical protein n=1 Tax=Sandarakinorhabdus sp. TaxID=1916663 RepID=UPI00286E9261